MRWLTRDHPLRYCELVIRFMNRLARNRVKAQFHETVIQAVSEALRLRIA
jgi:hypothetical protein